MADTFVDAVNAKAEGKNTISPEGLDLVKTFESFKPNAYYDRGGKKGTLTVGYGFTKHDIPSLNENFVMDKPAAEKLLPNLITNKYGSVVSGTVKVPLNDQQYSALASLAYNIGPTAFKNSTLVKKLNSGDMEGAAQEFAKWNKAGGKPVEGLTRRRTAEQALFKGDTMGLGKILEKQKFKLPASMKTTMFQTENPNPFPMPDEPQTNEETPQETQPPATNYLFT
jgi:lysozyme